MKRNNHAVVLASELGIGILFAAAILSVIPRLGLSEESRSIQSLVDSSESALVRGDGGELTADQIMYNVVVYRALVYKGSAYDAGQPGHDGAIAPNKQPLLPGGTGGQSNISNYGRRINCIYIDLKRNAAGPPSVTGSDFIVKVGNTSQTYFWQTGPVPSVTVIPGGGLPIGGVVDRIVLVWPDYPNSGCLPNATWALVTTKANANTRLPEDDVLFYGLLIGDSGVGNTGSAATVTKADACDVRQHTAGLSTLTEPWDMDRDGHIDFADELIVRDNYTSTGLLLIRAQ